MIRNGSILSGKFGFRRKRPASHLKIGRRARPRAPAIVKARAVLAALSGVAAVPGIPEANRSSTKPMRGQGGLRTEEGRRISRYEGGGLRSRHRLPRVIFIRPDDRVEGLVHLRVLLDALRGPIAKDLRDGGAQTLAPGTRQAGNCEESVCVAFRPRRGEADNPGPACQPSPGAPGTQARRGSPRPAPWHAGRGSEGVIISSRVCVAHGVRMDVPARESQEKAQHEVAMPI